MTPEIYAWAQRHGIRYEAIEELRIMFGTLAVDMPATDSGKSEAFVQSSVRLAAAQAGFSLWRNNVGALRDERGVPIRYGLANDSKQMNQRIKSGDLIGCRPYRMPDGSLFGRFVSRECKPVGWNYTGTDHERAQMKWIELVTALGGDAKFTTGQL